MAALVGAPWPDVMECTGHNADGDIWLGWECDQCNGAHRHVWASLFKWVLKSKEDPQPATAETPVPAHQYRMNKQSEPVATRCVICGGRKCDVPLCVERRHHLGHHQLTGGGFEKVGT